MLHQNSVVQQNFSTLHSNSGLQAVYSFT